MPSTCTITINGPTATITGDYPLSFLRELTSFPVKGANFSPAFRKGRWDGREHLMNKVTREFPSGLVSLVKEELLQKDPSCSVSVIDSRTPPTAKLGSLDLHGPLKGLFGVGKYDYQKFAAEAAIKAKRCILRLATNSGKSAVMAAITNRLQLCTLVVVPSKLLLRQLHKSFSEMVDVPPGELGMIGDGEFQVGDWVTISTATSLHNKLKDGSLDDVKDKWDLVFIDECHTSGAKTLFQALGELSAFYVIGMSGTPLDRSDGGNLKLIARTGPVAYEVRSKLLVERGISVQPMLRLLRVSEPYIPTQRAKVKLKYADVESEGYTNNKHLNGRIAKAAKKFIAEGKQVVLLISKIEHGENLLELMEGPKGAFIHGKSSDRQEALDLFVEGEYRYLIGSTILDTGIDISCIDVMFFCAGGMSVIGSLQRAGRGLRSGDGKSEVIFVDIINLCHKFLAKHSAARLATYRAEDCYKISMLDE
ncbi:MAG: DEAD/DEAH box helicase [Sulfurovum sp.]|nr:DEAD/DEAH box helicase [Sulfurovum sp.]